LRSSPDELGQPENSGVLALKATILPYSASHSILTTGIPMATTLPNKSENWLIKDFAEYL
jgi:hypothetical protein